MEFKKAYGNVSNYLGNREKTKKQNVYRQKQKCVPHLDFFNYTLKKNKEFMQQNNFFSKKTGYVFAFATTIS